MCAKSSSTRTSSAVEGEFLHELEEKMEVEHDDLYYIYLWLMINAYTYKKDKLSF